MTLSTAARFALPLSLLFATAALVHAQEPAGIRKVVLPSLDSQVAARIGALDRRLNPVHTPNLVAALTAQLALPALPFGTFSPILADARNRDIWEQLPDEYYRTMQASGDTLVTLPGLAKPAGIAWSSAQVRRLCHMRLASLPGANLESYRRRVDAEARGLLEEGRRSRSALPLRRLVDDLFCSRYGDQALDLLGDLAFERGRFEEAEHWWSQLIADDGRLTFPDPQVDLVRVQAKRVLAQMFAGRLNEAQTAIRHFQALHPRAKGHLAGQDGVYGSILERTLAALVRERIVNNNEPWTTFGGDPARNRTLSQGLSWRLWEDGPAWHVPLPTLDEAENGKDALPDRGSPTRRVAFHPLIVNHQVLIADHRSVVSYHLKTGKELFRYDLKTAGLADPGVGIDSRIPLPRFTLSADDQRAYVRLGGIGLGPKKAAATYLVCLDLSEPGLKKNRELWRVEASAEEKAVAAFEGAPLVYDGRVFIALSRLTGRRVVTSIVCYDVLGRRRWARDVCDCPEFEDGADGPRHRQHLLTYAGGQIVYASHTGAIVAVDALTGQPTWGVRYPSRGPLTAELEPSPRDLTPCMYADGQVFAAPLDTDRLFCIDATSGQVRWELEDIEVVHLYGVSGGRLFAATRTGLIAIHAANGQADWLQPSEGRLPSLGRGLIAGRWLLWPTQDANLPYRAVSLQAGMQQQDGTKSVLPEPDVFDPTMLASLPVGNLAFGQGCLAIAGLRELTVYVPAHKAQELPPDIRPQARVDSLYQRARWQTSAGQNENAVQTYRQLLDVTKADPRATTWRALIETRLDTLAPSTRTPRRLDPVKVVVGAERPIQRAGPELPLVQAWSHEGDHAWSGADVLFCTQGGQLMCRSLTDGTPRWRQPLDFAPAWLECWHNLVILAGPDAAQVCRVDDGRTVWSVAAPSRKWRLGSVQAGIPKIFHGGAGFIHVERWDDTLLLCDDQRQFLRVHLETGAVAWQHASPAVALRPLDAGFFGPHLARVGSNLLVQNAAGNPCWLATKPIQFGTPCRPWVQAPQVFGKRVLRADEQGRILAHHVAAPRDVAWTYQAPWPTSLSGDLSRLITGDDVLLAAIPRNEGNELIRLDPDSGKLLWTIPPSQLPDGLNHRSVWVGDTLFFYSDREKLYARSLNDGRLQWTYTLPTASVRWQLRYTKDYLAVYPVGGAKGESFGVCVIDPWTGSRLQRLTIPDAHGHGEVLLTPSRLLVSAGGRIYGFRSLDAE